jgi:DNA-binding response OmpR family regulator
MNALPPADHALLVADDADDIRNILVRFLKQAGYRADGARDGQEAVELATTQCYSLVLLDYEMPRRNGLDAGQAIFQATGTPFLLHSTDHEVGRLVAAAEGALGFIAKPVTRDEFMSRVAVALAEATTAFLNDPPVRGYGPCAITCTHRDCAWQRLAAASRCVLCGEPIGVGHFFYEYLGDVAHRDCLEGRLPPP